MQNSFKALWWFQKRLNNPILDPVLRCALHFFLVLFSVAGREWAYGVDVWRRRECGRQEQVKTAEAGTKVKVILLPPQQHQQLQQEKRSLYGSFYYFNLV